MWWSGWSAKRRGGCHTLYSVPIGRTRLWTVTVGTIPASSITRSTLYSAVSAWAISTPVWPGRPVKPYDFRHVSRGGSANSVFGCSGNTTARVVRTLFTSMADAILVQKTEDGRRRNGVERSSACKYCILTLYMTVWNWCNVVARRGISLSHPRMAIVLFLTIINYVSGGRQ